MQAEDEPDLRPESPGRIGSDAALLLALLWLTGLTWWMGLPAAPGYSFDDREAIVGNPVVEGTLPATEAFQRDYWHHRADAGHYRPLATLALRFDAARVNVLAPEAPRVFRVTNLALHLATLAIVGMAFLLLQRRGGPRLPWFGLGLWAVHPSSADAVAWISGRTSLLSGLGAGLGLALLVARPSRTLAFAGAFAGAGAALMAKEDGFVIAATAPLVAFGLARIQTPGGVDPPARGGADRFASALAGAAMAVLLVLWLRHSALGSWLPSAPAAVLSRSPLVERVTLGIAAWWHGVSAAVQPWLAAPPSLTLGDLTPGLPVEPTVRALVIGRGVPGFGLVGALLVLGAVAALVRRQRGAWLSLGLSVLAVVPLLQIVPAGELFAPRFLYQPLLLGALWTSALAAALTRALPRPAAQALQAVVLLAFAVFSSLHAAPTYDSRASYWQAHLPAHAGEAKILNALGECERELGHLVRASELFLDSHLADPRYSRPLANLGALEAKRNNLDTAAAYLVQAIREGPEEAAPRANLATVRMKQGRPEDALGLYQRAADLQPGRATFRRGVCRALLALGQLEEAQRAFDQASALAPEAAETERLARQLAEKLAERLEEAD